MAEDNRFSSLMVITDRPPIVMTEGKGSWLTDQNGKRYLDFVQGWAVNCLGHCPQVVVDAVARQAGRLINPSPAFYNDPAIELADMLTANSCLDRVFFTSTGAEANEGAIKLARKWGAKARGGAFEIITMENGFHGRTLATMSATGKSKWQELFEPKVPGFPKVALNNLGAVEAAITERTVAVMLEPIQGEAGVIPSTMEFLKGLRRLTEERGILLILDEVQTGMGRTGKLFAYQHAEIEPDIMTLGKGLGGGVPLAALVAKEGVCCFDIGDQGGTYNGNPVMTAAGCAVMNELLRPGFLQQVREAGSYLAEGLQKVAKVFGSGDLRGQGLLLALDLKLDLAPIVVENAREKGLLLNAPRPQTLRFMPSLNVSKEEIDTMLAILSGVLSELFSDRSHSMI